MVRSHEGTPLRVQATIQLTFGDRLPSPLVPSVSDLERNIRRPVEAEMEPRAVSGHVCAKKGSLCLHRVEGAPELLIGGAPLQSDDGDGEEWPAVMGESGCALERTKCSGAMWLHATMPSAITDSV